jgi:hypothetical protein
MNDKGFINSRTLLVMALAAVLVVLLTIHFLESSSATTTTQVTTTTAAGPTTTTTLANTPTAILPSQAAFPAYQHIPYSGDGITIGLVNVAPDGRLLLEVYSQTLTVSQEKAVYQAFLQSYGDPGTKYIPTFAGRK